jgi:hypothetical protein
VTGETGPSLARRAAWTVVNAAFVATPMAWPTARQRLTVLLSRPGDERERELQRRLDRTEQRMNESSPPAGSGWEVAADVWYEQVQQWIDLFLGVLDDRPELAGGLAELIEELTTRFGLPCDQPAPGGPAASPNPLAAWPVPPGSPPPGGPGYAPPAPSEAGPPGASFGDNDDLDE